MIYTDAEYLRAYVREVVEPPGYTTTAKRLLAIADRLEKIDTGQDEAIEALRKIDRECCSSRLFAMFRRQQFWHAHHVDLVWRHNGQDRREEADWLCNVWKLLKPYSTAEVEPLPDAMPSKRPKVTP